MDKAPDAFRTISEVADDLRVPQHVLRFWESRFTQIKPMKRAGGRRYYRPDDVDLLRGIHHLLYGEGYTIRGVQRILKDSGPKFVQSVWQVEAGAEEDAEAVENGAGENTGRRRGVFRVVPSLLGRSEPAQDDAEQDESEEEAAESDAIGQAAMSDDTLNKLREILDDLKECRRLLDAAIAPDAAPEQKED